MRQNGEGEEASKEKIGVQPCNKNRRPTNQRKISVQRGGNASKTELVTDISGQWSPEGWSPTTMVNVTVSQRLKRSATQAVTDTSGHHNLGVHKNHTKIKV